MNVWMLASSCILLAMVVPAYGALRGSALSRLVGVQVLTALTCLLLCLLTFATDQSSFTDLPLALALLSLVGTLLFAHFFERWL